MSNIVNDKKRYCASIGPCAAFPMAEHLRTCRIHFFGDHRGDIFWLLQLHVCPGLSNVYVISSYRIITNPMQLSYYGYKVQPNYDNDKGMVDEVNDIIRKLVGLERANIKYISLGGDSIDIMLQEIKSYNIYVYKKAALLHLTPVGLTWDVINKIAWNIRPSWTLVRKQSDIIATMIDFSKVINANLLNDLHSSLA